VLPRLAADMRRGEGVSAGLLFQQQKQTASLVPHTGADAFEAAATLGPEAASVLGGPLVAGEYQPHPHLHPPGGQQQQLPVATPDAIVTPSQQQLL
jgi:hypothetical protein